MDSVDLVETKEEGDASSSAQVNGVEPHGGCCGCRVECAMLLIGGGRCVPDLKIGAGFGEVQPRKSRLSYVRTGFVALKRTLVP